MNERKQEEWLDTLLQHPLPPQLGDDEGFQVRLLRRLPARERPWLRALVLGASWALAALALLWALAGPRLSDAEPGAPLAAFCLGPALLWYLVESRRR